VLIWALTWLFTPVRISSSAHVPVHFLLSVWTPAFSLFFANFFTCQTDDFDCLYHVFFVNTSCVQQHLTFYSTSAAISLSRWTSGTRRSPTSWTWTLAATSHGWSATRPAGAATRYNWWLNAACWLFTTASRNLSFLIWDPLLIWEALLTWSSCQNELCPCVTRNVIFVLSQSLCFFRANTLPNVATFWPVFVFYLLPVGLTQELISLLLPCFPHELTDFSSSVTTLSSFFFTFKFCWKCRILTCSLILCSWWLLQTPHPWYRPVAKKLVPCADPLCTALHRGLGSSNKCPSPKQCDYHIKYTDGSTSQGVLISDTFSLPWSKSSTVHPSLTFGYVQHLREKYFKHFLMVLLDSVCWYGCFCLHSCGYDQQVGKNNEKSSRTDGLLGLGRGSVGLVSQLKQQGITKNVLGHCMSTKGGGFLFFGDGIVPKSGVTWVPMARTTSG
jgi:hypothetical protein